MNRKLRVRATLLLSVSTTLIAFGASTGMQAASAAVPAPFLAFYSGTFVPTSTGFGVSGTGHATLLGRTSNHGTVVMLSQPNPACPTTGFVVVNDETLTAANGDLVTLTILDKPCPVPGEPGIYDGKSTYHVTGGTGRFAGATGQGSFDGRGDFTNPDHLTFTYKFAGTISVANGK